MAEHELNLKATLDTTDVEEKLANLENLNENLENADNIATDKNVSIGLDIQTVKKTVEDANKTLSQVKTTRNVDLEFNVEDSKNKIQAINTQVENIKPIKINVSTEDISDIRDTVAQLDTYLPKDKFINLKLRKDDNNLPYYADWKQVISDAKDQKPYLTSTRLPVATEDDINTAEERRTIYTYATVKREQLLSNLKNKGAIESTPEETAKTDENKVIGLDNFNKNTLSFNNGKIVKLAFDNSEVDKLKTDIKRVKTKVVLDVDTSKLDKVKSKQIKIDVDDKQIQSIQKNWSDFLASAKHTKNLILSNNTNINNSENGIVKDLANKGYSIDQIQNIFRKQGNQSIVNNLTQRYDRLNESGFKFDQFNSNSAKPKDIVQQFKTWYDSQVNKINQITDSSLQNTARSLLYHSKSRIINDNYIDNRDVSKYNQNNPYSMQMNNAIGAALFSTAINSNKNNQTNVIQPKDIAKVQIKQDQILTNDTYKELMNFSKIVEKFRAYGSKIQSFTNKKTGENPHVVFNDLLETYKELYTNLYNSSSEDEFNDIYQDFDAVRKEITEFATKYDKGVDFSNINELQKVQSNPYALKARVNIYRKTNPLTAGSTRTNDLLYIGGSLRKLSDSQIRQTYLKAPNYIHYKKNIGLNKIRDLKLPSVYNRETIDNLPITGKQKAVVHYNLALKEGKTVEEAKSNYIEELNNINYSDTQNLSQKQFKDKYSKLISEGKIEQAEKLKAEYVEIQKQIKDISPIISKTNTNFEKIESKAGILPPKVNLTDLQEKQLSETSPKHLVSVKTEKIKTPTDLPKKEEYISVEESVDTYGAEKTKESIIEFYNEELRNIEQLKNISLEKRRELAREASTRKDTQLAEVDRIVAEKEKTAIETDVKKNEFKVDQSSTDSITTQIDNWYKQQVERIKNSEDFQKEQKQKLISKYTSTKDSLKEQYAEKNKDDELKLKPENTQFTFKVDENSTEVPTVQLEKQRTNTANYINSLTNQTDTTKKLLLERLNSDFQKAITPYYGIENGQQTVKNADTGKPEQRFDNQHNNVKITPFELDLSRDSDYYDQKTKIEEWYENEIKIISSLKNTTKALRKQLISQVDQRKEEYLKLNASDNREFYSDKKIKEEVIVNRQSKMNQLTQQMSEGQISPEKYTGLVKLLNSTTIETEVALKRLVKNYQLAASKSGITAKQVDELNKEFIKNVNELQQKNQKNTKNIKAQMPYDQNMVKDMRKWIAGMQFTQAGNAIGTDYNNGIATALIGNSLVGAGTGLQTYANTAQMIGTLAPNMSAANVGKLAGSIGIATTIGSIIKSLAEFESAIRNTSESLNKTADSLHKSGNQTIRSYDLQSVFRNTIESGVTLKDIENASKKLKLAERNVENSKYYYKLSQNETLYKQAEVKAAFDSDVTNANTDSWILTALRTFLGIKPLLNTFEKQEATKNLEREIENEQQAKERLDIDISEENRNRQEYEAIKQAYKQQIDYAKSVEMQYIKPTEYRKYSDSQLESEYKVNEDRIKVKQFDLKTTIQTYAENPSKENKESLDDLTKEFEILTATSKQLNDELQRRKHYNNETEDYWFNKDLNYDPSVDITANLEQKKILRDNAQKKLEEDLNNEVITVEDEKRRKDLIEEFNRQDSYYNKLQAAQEYQKSLTKEKEDLRFNDAIRKINIEKLQTNSNTVTNTEQFNNDVEFYADKVKKARKLYEEELSKKDTTIEGRKRLYETREEYTSNKQKYDTLLNMQVSELQNSLSNLKAPNMSNVNSLASQGYMVSEKDDNARQDMQLNYIREQTNLQRDIKNKLMKIEGSETEFQ